jgi:zinc protease
MRSVLTFVFLFLFVSLAAGYDLSRVQISRLENGLTVMMLEDHEQPLVSTQMLYKVGARDECVGTTGIAHFVEHMAYRATQNFPGTEVVSKIYAVGGEWHGYTWIDETTYFETVPSQDLDLVLQIQADRMNHAKINAEEVDAERGSVLTELHSYENDPALVLSDQVLAVSFMQHPYRFNTIGWTSDVEKITHEDLVNFYHRYYRPSNAVFAVVGDISPADVLNRIKKYFASIPAGQNESTMPRTVEPPQHGEKRIVLQGEASLNYFQITYRAPAATDPDYPAFLLLQAVLGGGPGLNLRQDLDGKVVQPGTRLAGIGHKISTFFMPTADPYVFSIVGNADPSTTPSTVEAEIEKRLAAVRDAQISIEELGKARKQLSSELVFDIETTEDAAHQMAYFGGIEAFSVLQKLPAILQSLRPADVQLAAQKYLQPYQRTIGWYLGKSKGTVFLRPSVSRIAAKTIASRIVDPSVRIRTLKNGITVIAHSTHRTPSGFLRILVPSNTVESDEPYTADSPVWRYTSLHWRFLNDDFAATIAKARKVFDMGLGTSVPDETAFEDPEYRLDQTLKELLGAHSSAGPGKPVLIVFSGDMNPDIAASTIERAFSGIRTERIPPAAPLQIDARDKTVRLPGKAQSQYGYAVPAPSPSSPNSLAYRILLYVLTHGYEGRLGKELIANRGLIYYISSNYNSDGKNSWISMSYGVNPDKQDETAAVFNRLMEELRTNPPTAEEVAEAKEHLIGRRITAYQSNEEETAFFAREWIEQKRIVPQDEFQRKVREVTLPQVQAIIPEFLNGVRATVDTTL